LEISFLGERIFQANESIEMEAEAILATLSSYDPGNGAPKIKGYNIFKDDWSGSDLSGSEIPCFPSTT
jgi:hypothetical protein